jgi:hypothetical protein
VSLNTILNVFYWTLFLTCYSQKHCFNNSGYMELYHDVRLNTYLHLVPRFRMSGATPSLPLYVFVAYMETTLPLHLFFVTQSSFGFPSGGFYKRVWKIIFVVLAFLWRTISLCIVETNVRLEKRNAEPPLKIAGWR